MSFPTLSGDGVPGSMMREPQVCLGPSFSQGSYQFFVSGSAFATPANVYQDAGLTTPFPNTGVVNADAFGRFPPIYLDGSIIYAVILTNAVGTQVYAIDPYVSPLSTRGLSTNVAFGPQIAATGEVVLAAPAAGGSQITLKASAGVAGQAAIQLNGSFAGSPAIIINNSVTTGAQTATFAANQKPGTQSQATLTPSATVAPSGATYTGGNLTANFTGATASNYTLILSTGQTIINCTFTNGSVAFTTPSTNITGTPTTTLTVAPPCFPAGWLPVQCDGVIYYTPIWHGNNFTPYVANPAAVGETINAGYVTFGGNGVTTPNNGTAVPGNWFSPTTNNIGASYWINITKTGGNSGTSFSAAQGAWVNITNGGLVIGTVGSVNTNLQGTYQLSTSAGGTPVVASGTIQLSNNSTGTGANDSVAYTGTGPLNLAGNGTSTLNGVSTANWFLPTTGSIGASYWINITRTGGTAGINFTNAQGVWTNITAGGLSIDLTGNGQRSVQGTYQIASNSSGTLVVSSGTISLTDSGVNNSNYSGTAPLVLAGNGTATLNGVSSSNWFSPTTANTGAGYWVDITRTGGTSGVNFSAAQGAWTNITNSGISITLTGTSGLVGTATASGTYGISNSSSGSPVLGSGTISLSISGLTVIHIYTSVVTNATETIPTGSTTVQIEAWAAGGGGGDGTSGCVGQDGVPGGTGSFGFRSWTVSAIGGVGKTFKYTIGAGGAGNSGNGGASSITAGTVTGFTSLLTNGGIHATNHSGGAGGAAGSGGTTNTAGIANSITGRTGSISGDGGPYGGGGTAGHIQGGSGGTGQNGACVFKYL